MVQSSKSSLFDSKGKEKGSEREWRRKRSLSLRFDANELAATPPSPRTTTPKVLVNTMIRYSPLFFSFLICLSFSFISIFRTLLLPLWYELRSWYFLMFYSIDLASTMLVSSSYDQGVSISLFIFSSWKYCSLFLSIYLCIFIFIVLI